jgi:hypothetical protein
MYAALIFRLFRENTVNRRNLISLVIVILVATFSVQMAMAQSDNAPQAIVNVEQTVIRATPGQGGGICRHAAGQ